MSVRIVITQGPRPLTRRAKRFALAMARGEFFSAKRAAIAAGYAPRSASARAYKLLCDERVQAIIAAEEQAADRAREAVEKKQRIEEARANARAAVERMLYGKAKGKAA